MFQVVMFALALNAGMQPPQVRSEPTFNTLQECADYLPDELLRLHAVIEEQDAPYIVALGCIKTGERS